MTRRNPNNIPLKADARISTLTELSGFLEQIADTIDIDKPQTFWECEPAFLRLLNSGFLKALVNYELSGMIDNPLYVPPGTFASSDIMIALSEKCVLSLRIITGNEKSSDRVYSATEHVIIGLVAFKGSSPIAFEVFEQPCPDPNDVFDRSRHLQPLGTEILQPGAARRFRAAADIARILPNGIPAVMLILSSSTIAPIRWEYDLATLSPVKAIAGYPTSSRLEYTAKLLAEVGDKTSVQPLKSLMQHEDHFVRWAAVRALVSLDYAEGVASLHDALQDPHPHVRNAARKVISLLELNEPSRTSTSIARQV